MANKEDKEYQKINTEAWGFYDKDNLDKAFDTSKKIIELYPKKIGGYYLSGIIEYDKRNFVKSVEYFKNALEVDSENKAGGFIHYWLGKNYNEKSKEWFNDFVDNPVYSFDMARFSFEKSTEYEEYPRGTVVELIRIFRKDNYKLITVLKNALKNFSSDIDFLIRYSRALTQINKNEDAYNIVSTKANELNSPSLYYEGGMILYKSKDYKSAILNFEKAVTVSSGKPENVAGIYCQIADAYYKEKNFENASKNFNYAFELIISYNLKNTDYPNNAFWLALFGIIITVVEVKQIDELNSSILKIPFTEETIDYIESFHEFTIETGSGVVFSYENDFSIRKCITELNKFKKKSNDPITLSKLNWLKAILYYQDNKHEYSLNALREVLKNDNNSDSYIYKRISRAYYYCLNDRISSKKSYDDLMTKLGLDLNKYRPLRNNFDEYYIEQVIDWLFSDENYQAIIELKKHFTSIQLDKSKSWFEIAYSYHSIEDEKNAQKAYEYYLSKNKDSSAALNNLANIYHKKGDIKYVEKAIKLYEKAIKIDGGDEKLYARNLKNTKETREFILKEKSKNDFLEKTFKRAIKLLNKEDYFSLESLHNFLLNIRKDDDYNNGEIPIQDDYFPSLMNTNISKAEKLKDIWLSKNYVYLTDDFDDYDVPIYKVNPYIEDAVNKQRKVIAENDLPIKWLEGIEGLNVSKLEEIQYFNIIEKIGKINKKYKPLVKRDFNELVFNYLVGNIKATIVLSGSFVELVLTYFLERKKHTQIQYSNTRPKNLYDCNLFDLISFSEEKGFFGKDFFHLTNLSRVYRNFIHPGLELKNELNKGKSDLCFISTLEIFKLI
ncbi:hypothetical protein [uncultured Algibacter sp.]|uniref:tetratricopeptide repeat protein n=1 Tax=uncultured Algibacter sp. TaxID=298659 RepID=UPI002606AB0D|nr:hypothetical protein [uncultured Algibacter sp.]